MSNIQWFPGHMTSAMRMMQENLKLVDILIELLDARIPNSSKNPALNQLAQNKKRIIVLNKADLADEKLNEIWLKHYQYLGYSVTLTNSAAGRGLDDTAKAARLLMAEKIERQKQRGRLVVPIRAMIVGIPNVGKSTIINRYAKRYAAKVEDRPGVTKGKQWIKILSDFELLDTPGILWPKFEDSSIGRNLALIGSINDNILNLQELAYDLIEFIKNQAPSGLKNRYNIDFNEESNHNILLKIGTSRGFKSKDGQIDIKRCANTLIDEFRAGKLGRITLEIPSNKEEEIK